MLGEANFSDHGANRLGASALMQGLADGYFVIPYTIGDYLAGARFPEVTDAHPAFGDSDTAGAGAHRQTADSRTASAPSTTSTASSGSSCGTTAGCPATQWA